MFLIGIYVSRMGWAAFSLAAINAHCAVNLLVNLFAMIEIRDFQHIFALWVVFY